MGPQMPSAPPVLSVLGCLVLLLWLWVLCTSCHRKRARRRQAELQGSTEQSLLRRPHLCTLSTSDTRLHELQRGPPGRTAPRPASMDLRPPCLEASRSTARPLAACSYRELPRPGPAPSATQPSAGPEATYSNVGLAAIPRASLAASPMVWAGSRLIGGCARPGPEASPVVAEYACVQKLKGAARGPQGPEQGKAKGTPATQVDILYSRVSKPKRREPEPAIDPLDPTGRGTGLTLGSNHTCETLPLRGPSVDKGLLENVYESIQEMGVPECQEPPRSTC